MRKLLLWILIILRKSISFFIQLVSPPEPKAEPVYLHHLVFESNDVIKPVANHAGNIGDIIMSCLYLKTYWQQTHQKIHLHLQTNKPTTYAVTHPLKNISMSDEMANQLMPLLKAQPYIANVSIGNELPENVTFNLDDFKKLPINHACGLIQGWYQLCTNFWLNPFESWITTEHLNEFKDTIIVSRTERLRSQFINYKFLSRYRDSILFIGLPHEYDLFKEETAIDCHNITSNNFYHLASMICSSKLFIGNQGFLYSIAESVKCPRVLESNHIAPNNFPLSENGRIAIYQNQFEHFIDELLEKSRQQ